MKTHSSRYDIEGLAKELEVDISDISGLYSSYVEEMKSDVTEMEECLANSDWGMLQRVVHNIKGVSANLNIQDVFLGAEKLDMLLKSGITESVSEHVGSLIILMEEAEKEIKIFFTGQGFDI